MSAVSVEDITFRIYRCPVYSDLIVNMGSCGSACIAHETHDVTPENEAFLSLE
jgi:hypothetical protein